MWIALDTATPENGCMHLLTGKHRDGSRLHFQRRDWQIRDTELLGTPCVAAPFAPGGCMLFGETLPHRTPHNRSGRPRRA